MGGRRVQPDGRSHAHRVPTGADCDGRVRHARRAARQDREPRRSIRFVGWTELGEHVRRCRSLRRQTQAEFAREVGLSVRLIGALEAGQPRSYDATTIDKIELSLGWQQGSFDRVVEGGQPSVHHDPMLARIINAWPRLPPEARRMLSDNAGSAVRPDD